jgi:hypothetical protein
MAAHTAWIWARADPAVDLFEDVVEDAAGFPEAAGQVQHLVAQAVGEQVLGVTGKGTQDRPDAHQFGLVFPHRAHDGEGGEVEDRHLALADPGHQPNLQDLRLLLRAHIG